MKNKKILTVIIGVLVIAIAGSSYFSFRSSWKFREDRPIKIFYLNSFHPVFTFTLEHIRGFEDVFNEEGIEFTIKSFEMDAIRRSSEELKKATGIKAKELIDEWQPDLIFATDDPAQSYVIQPYFLNSDIPVVFASVDRDPFLYDYIGSKNIAGVISLEHIDGGLTLLRSLYPRVRTVAVISTLDDLRGPLLDRLKAQEVFPDMEFVGFNRVASFEEFKEKVLFYQDKADAFFFTPLGRLLDEEGNNVTETEVEEWVVEHNTLPEITLWRTLDLGMLASVVVSQYEQGRAAGKIAQEILIDGKAPSQFEFKPTLRGDQFINIARAKTLGLAKEDIPSVILINSKIIETFPWDD